MKPGRSSSFFHAALVGIVRPLGQNDVIFAYLFVYQSLRVRLDLAIAGNGMRRREGSNDVGIATF